MEDEKLNDNPAINSIGLDQRLVKAWRMGEFKRHNRHTEVTIAVYLAPKWGIFYARVPETDEGTLYASADFHTLRILALDGAEELAEADLSSEHDARQWERCIRIRYENGNPVVGEVVTAKPEGEGHQRWLHRSAIDGALCAKVGALTFARFERSPQPDGARYDEREWLEDFDLRMVRWRADDRLTGDERRYSKPARGVRTSWVTTPGHLSSFERVVPWTPETWAQLTGFTRLFSNLDKQLTAFLLEESEAAFLQQLSQSPRLLAGPEGS